MIEYKGMELYAPLGADGRPYDIFKSQPIICTVEGIPKKLIFGQRKIFFESVEELDLTPDQRIYLYKARREAKFSEITTTDAPIPGSMRWRTSVQIKVKDIVWVSSGALMRASEQNMIIKVEGEYYYLIKYEDIYMRKLSTGVQMLNGWILAELIDDVEQWILKAKKTGIIIPDSYKHKEFNDRFGLIKYIGEPVEYLFNESYDHPEIKSGDIVMFAWKVNRRLEPGNKYFAKDSDMIVTRRERILAIMS
jgi:co-chaperonin GroES (HSP10)